MSESSISILAPAPVLEGGDDCGAGLTDQNAALGLRLAGLFGIAACSTIGVFLPLLLKSRNLSVPFFFGTAFAAGVVLATGFAHVLPDAIEALTNPCLAFSGEYPWAEVFAGGAAILTFALETLLRSLIVRRLGGGSSAGHISCHSVKPAAPTDADVEVANVDTEKKHAIYRQEMNVIAIVLEAGFVFHSIFVGIDLGILREASVARALMIALMFHQGFEGLALGSQFMRAEFSKLKYTLLAVIFILITPLGVAIGIGVGNSYQADSKTALGFEGAFNSVSAGILIYNGLVDLILPTLSASPSILPHGPLQALPWFFLLAGYSCMSLLAKWA